MPSYRHHHFGDLYIHFTVDFPPNHWKSQEIIAQLENILPPRPIAKLPSDAMVDDVAIEDLDAHQQKRVGQDMDDDENAGPPGSERVQCAPQ